MKNLILAVAMILTLGACDGSGLGTGGDTTGVDGGGAAVDAQCSVVSLATVPGLDWQQDIPLGSFSGRAEAGVVVYVDGSPIPAGCWAFYGAQSLHVLPMVFRDNNPHVVGISFGCVGVDVPAGHPNAGATCGWW